MILQRLTNLILTAALAVAGYGESDPAVTVDPPPPPESAIRPPSGQRAEDAASVHAPFGPWAHAGRFTLRLTPVGFRVERVATALDGTALLGAGQ
jgi:hypothetical protein